VPAAATILGLLGSLDASPSWPLTTRKEASTPTTLKTPTDGVVPREHVFIREVELDAR
jgi:hypothetical protein